MKRPNSGWTLRHCLKLTTLACIGISSLAHANTCITFEDAIQQASTNFETPPVTPFTIYGIMPNLCDVATTSDGIKIYHCRWDYGYRTSDAAELLRTINIDIQRCLGIQSRKIEDGVNHPDTYEQRLYRLGDINISLSLKDKAALNQSFVSLQISGAKPD